MWAGKIALGIYRPGQYQDSIRDGVAALMVRGTAAEVAKVNALADAIANSYR